MSKAIKIAGIVLVSLIVLIIFLNILFSASRGMLSGSNSEFGDNSSMMEVGSLPSGSLSFGSKSASVRVKSDSSMMMSESASPMNDAVVSVLC